MLLVFLGTVSIALAQRTVRGTVTDENEEPLIGATVIVRGTSVGVTTNLDGQYSIEVPAGSEILVVSYTGYGTREVTLGASNVADVILVTDVLQLETAVVTAIGITRQEKSLGYAVQMVDAEEFQRSANTNMLNSLTGKVAGVQITSATGAAGGAANILIRGAASLTGNNQPLFVIDGVPIDNSQVNTENPLFGAAYSNRAIDLNPEEIESINVLKGGAATALYGMRAANGVIMVNTKRGQAGKMRIDISSSVTVDQWNKLPEMQNRYAQGTFGNFSPTTLVWGPSLDDIRHDPNTPSLYYPQGAIRPAADVPNGIPVQAYDAPDQFFRNGMTYNNNISLSGGNDRTTYFFSLGNVNQTGIIPNNSFERTNATLSAQHKMNSRLTTSARVSYTRSNGTRIQQGSNTSGVMLALMRMPPNFDNTGGVNPEKDKSAYELADGRQRNAYNGLGYDNPFWTAYKNPMTDEVDRLIAYTQIDYKITSWMSLMYRLGNDFWSDRRKQQFAVHSRTAPPGRVIEDQISNTDLNSDLILSIDQYITPDLKMNILLGNNLFSSRSNRLNVRGDQLALLDYYNLNNTASQVVFQSIGRKRTSAYFADFGFDWRSMLYLNVTVRNESSTSLPDGNNNFWFPSFNGSFVFTELDGLRDSEWLTFGKIRGSWSRIANDAPIYSTQQLFVRGGGSDGWTTGIDFPAFGVNAFQISAALANPDLRPEFATSREVGLDLRFLRNRLGLDFTYYNNLHEDLILSVPVAQSSGATSAVLNAGSMKNVGFEVLLRANPVRTRDFSWDILLNWTRNVNEVLELAPGVENVFLGGFVGSQARAVVGEPYGSIFGESWTRHANGQILIGDNGFPFGTGEDTNIGNVLPEWIMGITNSFTYKNVGLSFLWDIKQGGYMWNGTKGAMYYFGTHKDTESRSETSYVFPGVKADGSPNDIEVVRDIDWYVLDQGSGFTGPAEPYVEEAGWVRLREVTLSYNFSSNLLSRANIRNAEIFFTGRNLFLSTPFTGIDPETSLIGAGNAQGLEYFNMPGTKSYMVGVRLGL